MNDEEEKKIDHHHTNQNTQSLIFMAKSIYR